MLAVHGAQLESRSLAHTLDKCPPKRDKSCLFFQNLVGEPPKKPLAVAIPPARFVPVRARVTKEERHVYTQEKVCVRVRVCAPVLFYFFQVWRAYRPMFNIINCNSILYYNMPHIVWDSEGKCHRHHSEKTRPSARPLPLHRRKCHHRKMKPPKNKMVKKGTCNSVSL